jgi:hypothetical protein
MIFVVHKELDEKRDPSTSGRKIGAGWDSSGLRSSFISYNEAMLGAVREKKLVFVTLLAVAFAVGFAIGVSMWEGEPATEEKSKSGEPAIRGT